MKEIFSYNKLGDRKGQLLIEAMVALSVLVVGLFGILGLLTRSIKINRIVSDNYTATYLASEGIEIVKNLLDHNVIASSSWDSALENDGTYEVDYTSTKLSPYTGRALSLDPNSGLFSYGGSGQAIFARAVTISHVDVNEIQVKSEVVWSSGAYQSSVNLEDRFFKWRP